MASNFINIPIYQVGGFSDYNSPFPVFMDFPVGGLFVRGITPPLNTVRGVLCYGAVRSWANGNKEFYTNLSMAEIIALAGTVSNGLSTEDGSVLTTEDGTTLTTES